MELRKAHKKPGGRAGEGSSAGESLGFLRQIAAYITCIEA